MGRRTGRLTPAKLCSDVQLNCKKSAEVIVAKKIFFAKDRTIIVLKTKGRRSNAKTTLARVCWKQIVTRERVALHSLKRKDKTVQKIYWKLYLTGIT